MRVKINFLSLKSLVLDFILNREFVFTVVKMFDAKIFP